MPARSQRKPHAPAAALGISILAGGESSRMGRDKSRLRLGRCSLLTHARATAQDLGLPIRVIRRDIIAPCGPLSGVYTALESSPAEAELFLACDMPFVSATVLRRVIRSFRAQDQACFATVNRLAGFPFIVRSSCARLVAKEIRHGHWSLQKLAGTLNARRVAIPRREHPALFNVNTPADLESARNIRPAPSDPRRP